MFNHLIQLKTDNSDFNSCVSSFLTSRIKTLKNRSDLSASFFPSRSRILEITGKFSNVKMIPSRWVFKKPLVLS